MIFGQVMDQIKRNPSYHACFPILILWASFGGKMGVVTTQAPTGQRSQTPTKNLATALVGPIVSIAISKTCLKKFQALKYRCIMAI